MVKKPTKKDESHPPLEDSTRLKLSESAKKLFSIKGFDAVTVKDIADDAGVNVSLVSYHFEGKQGLYKSVIENFGQDRFAVAKRVLQLPETFDEMKVRLEMLVNEVFGAHLDQPQNVCILMREIENKTPVAEEIFAKTFMKCFELVIEFFRHSQKQGFIRKDIAPLNIAMIFYGSVLHIAQKDVIGEKFFGVTIKNEGFKKEIISSLMSVIFEGLRERK